MDYIDGELPDHVRMCFDMHLQMCPPCVEYLKTYRATVALTKTCCQENPACKCDEMPEALVKAILSTRKIQPA
jgi:anti-sigma factor RsiW